MARWLLRPSSPERKTAGKADKLSIAVQRPRPVTERREAKKGVFPNNFSENQGDIMKKEQLTELLYQALETEKGGVRFFWA